MSVSLSPAQSLGFPRPLTSLVKRTLSVTNANAHPVAFKVKTTAPKQYCVRPNSGRIEPGETVHVQVLLQPMKEDPAPGTKCRDKFLVQSVIITPERETSSLPELWAVVEQEDKIVGKEHASVHEQKIRCTYLPAEEHEAPIPEEAEDTPTSTLPTRGLSAGSEGEESHFKNTTSSVSPPSTSSALPDADTSLATDSSFSAQEFVPSASTSTLPNGYTDLLPSSKVAAVGVASGAALAAASVVGVAAVEKESSKPYTVPAPTPPTTILPRAAAVAPTPITPAPVLAPVVSVPTTKSAANGSDIEAEYAAALKEIISLKGQLVAAQAQTNVLRARKPVAAVVAGAETKTIQHPGSVEGVPLNVVLGIVAGTFVLTWLFF